MRYRLFLVAPDDIPGDEPYYLITAKYSLLYTQNEPPERNREITEVSNLPQTVKDWLAGCIDELRSKALEQQRDELLSERGPAFMEALKNALDAERDRQMAGAGEQATGNRQ